MRNLRYMTGVNEVKCACAVQKELLSTLSQKGPSEAILKKTSKPATILKKKGAKIDAESTGCLSPNGLRWRGEWFSCKYLPPSRGSIAHGNSSVLGIPCIWVGAFRIRNAHQRLVVVVVPTITHIDGLLGISGVGESRGGECWDGPSGGVSRERGGIGEPDDGSQRPLVVVDGGDDIRTAATDLPRLELAGESGIPSPEAVALPIGLTGVRWCPALFQSKEVRPEGGFDFACSCGVTNLPRPEEVVLRARS